MGLIETIKEWFMRLNISAADIVIKVVSCLVILLIGFIAAKLARLFIKRVLHELSVNKTVNTIIKKEVKLEEGVSNAAAYIIYFITVVIILNQLGITSIVLYMITAALLLLIIILFFVGFKDLLPNLFASFVIYRKATFRSGDTIKYKGIEGVIEEITLLETKLKTKKGELIFIPNSTIIKSDVLIKKRKAESKSIESKK